LSNHFFAFEAFGLAVVAVQDLGNGLFEDVDDEDCEEETVGVFVIAHVPLAIVPVLVHHGCVDEGDLQGFGQGGGQVVLYESSAEK
jgi:hypothetical protein